MPEPAIIAIHITNSEDPVTLSIHLRHKYTEECSHLTLCFQFQFQFQLSPLQPTNRFSSNGGTHSHDQKQMDHPA